MAWDTHDQTHTVAAIDPAGRLLGHATFPADRAGYRLLLGWLRRHGDVVRLGVEGTGSYGAGLARFLTAAGVELVEIDRPDRQTRRRLGKSDPIDAEAAARATLAATATGTPKTRTGPVEAIRVLRVARRGAIKARTAALNTLVQTVVSAPEALHHQLTGLRGARLVQAAAALRPSGDLTDPAQATKLALRRLAQRCGTSTPRSPPPTTTSTLIKAAAPSLLAQYGVGVDVAGQLLVTAGDNPDRLRTEAAFAALCGASPVPVSSGRTDRHRLNRGGDRHANSALFTVTMVRMCHHQPTRD
ncbi:transposase [Kribbella sp. NPDC049174]|uniref:IS110 family transposase n=1 Tax=Kribbella sp. NPDC049174 TaxID=3364112 RepID=UPI0037149ED7